MSEINTTPETGTTQGTEQTQETATEPAVLTLLQKCKNALGVTDPEYDDEIQDLIDAAKADLGIAGVTKNTVETDPLIRKAILTYVSMEWNIAAPEHQALVDRYNVQKGQLQSATGYTDWMNGEPDPEDDSADGQAEETGGEGDQEESGAGS